MAKFQDKHVKLRDNQRVYFGDSDDCSMWRDGAMLRVSCTISGVTPTQNYHLATKQYVDNMALGLDWQDSVLTISGSPPGSPSTGDRYLITASGASGAWSGHEDDITEWDGSEWDFTDPDEGFATFVEDVDTVYVYSNSQWVKMASIFDHGGLAGLGDDDHLQYVRVDGGPADSRGFTSTVSGIYPTQSYHLTTKQYVDDEITTLSGNLGDHGNLTGLSDDDHTQYVPTDGSRGFTSTVSGVYPIAVNDLVTKGYADEFRAQLAGTTYFLHDHEDPTVSGYEQLLRQPGDEAEGYDSVSITSGDGETFIDQYVTVSGEPNTEFIPNGVWVFNIYAYCDNGSVGNSYVRAKMYKRSSAAVETYLFEGTTPSLSTGGPTLYSVQTSASGIYMDVTDRLVVKFYAETTSGSSREIRYYYEGSENYTHLITPVVTNFVLEHNNLQGLNVGDYKHLTAVEYTDLTDGGATTLHKHDHGNMDGLSDDDHVMYVRADGLRPFTGTVSGISPVDPAHLATKGYIDNAITTLSGYMGDHGNLSGLLDDDHTQYILVDGSRGFTSTVSGITPTLDNDLATKWYVDDAVTLTSGSIAFAGADGKLTEDNANLFWDDVNDRLGIFTNEPNERLDVDGNVAIGPHEGKKLRLIGDSNGNTYIQAGYDTADTTAKLRISRYSTTGAQLASLHVFADDSYFSGNVTISGGILQFDTGTSINEFSTDTTLAGNSDDAVPTEKAVKTYVDSRDDLTETGRTALVLDEYQKCVSFNTNFPDNSYILSVILRNTVDAEPAVYPMLVTSTTASGFCVLFSGDIDSNNYYLDWMARYDE